MKEVNWQDFKVRCSAIGKVLSESSSNPTITEKQTVRLAELEAKEKLTDPMKAEMAKLLVNKANSTKIILSDTCIEYLMEVYAWKTEGMIAVNKESLDLMQLKKGKQCEDESIRLLSMVKGIMYEKNMEQISNDFLTGELDVYAGKSIYEADIVEDTKSIWDYPTYLRCLHKNVETAYKNQIKGYGDISTAKELYVSKCLVSASPEVIEDMKWKLIRKMGVATEESPEFKHEWDKWERSMIFDSIPINQRVFSQKVDPFTEFERQKLYDRVKICRDWLEFFHENYIKMNL